MLAQQEIEQKVGKLQLETARLLLRRVSEQDREVEIAQQQDPQVMRYIRQPNTPEQAHETFNQMIAPWQADDEQNPWATINVEIQSSGQSVGSVAFRFESLDFAIVEIGYRFLPQSQGKGYATEAVKALVQWLIKDIGVHKVVAKCDPENVASYKIMEKLSMQREGFLRQHYKIGDQYSDELVYGILATEYDLI